MFGRRGAIVGLVGAWLVGAGCAASGSDGQVNGPMYDLDAGSGDSASTTPEGDGAPNDSSTTTGPHDGSSSGNEGGSTAPVDGGDSGSTKDGGDAGDSSAPPSDGGCTSTTALLGGSTSMLFAATAVGTGTFTPQSLTGSATSTPALVAFGSGFQALFTESGDAGGGNAIFATGYGGGSWSAPAALGGATDALGAPGVAVVGATMQGVYLNPSHLFFHAAYGTSWDTGADAVRTSDGGPQAFGPVAASAAGTSTDFVIAYEGNNLLPYAQTWSSSAGWDDGVPLEGAGTAAMPANTGMVVTALDGASADLLAVFIEAGGACTGATDCLYAVTRTSGVWSAPALVNVAAYTPTAPTLATMSGGRALLAWKGGNGEGYASVYTSGATPAWSVPAPLTSAQLASPPSIAQGVCGDDAEAAYTSGGQVYTTHFAGGAWTTPATVTGGAGAAFVAIATSR
jgi:hypothetical protein